jgi:PAS domain S-box-containing protein
MVQGADRCIHVVSVLYVDDDPDLLRIGKIHLERTGTITVDTAPSAREALDMLACHGYDAIVSDYQMPGMDDIEFLKQVRSIYGDLPFILFTGMRCEEISIGAINNGADFYLQKGGDLRSQFAELAPKIHAAVERRQAIDALKRSEQRFSDIIDFLPDATFAIDVKGRVIAWNRALEKLTGVPAAAMLGKGNYEYAIPFYGERRPILVDMLLASEEELPRCWYSVIENEGTAMTAENPTSHLRGSPAVLLGKASLLCNKSGSVVGAVESIRDITDDRKAEEALIQANRQLQMLASVTRHDILNKTTVLREFLNIAQEKETDPALREILETISSAAATISDQIEFTRVYEDLGSQKPRWQALAGGLPFCQAPPEIAFEVALDGIEVFADPMLPKVFFNLLDNSIRHGGRVTRIRVRAERTGNGVTIVWEDDGVGIPSAEKTLIFERGYGKNTGLGLFLVREILTVTGISIRETGVPGEGARFEILVPTAMHRAGTGS